MIRPSHPLDLIILAYERTWHYLFTLLSLRQGIMCISFILDYLVKWLVPDLNGVRFPAGATPGRTRRPYAAGTSCWTLMAIRFRVQESVAPCLHSCAKTGTTYVVNVVTRCLPDRLTRGRELPALRLTYKRDGGPPATQIAAPYFVFISALPC